MNQRYLILILFFYFASSNKDAFAQERTISGIVTDSGGIDLPGVKVEVKGTLSGTMSDATGRYSIAMPDRSNVLVFSFIGFHTREVKIGNQTVVDVVLEEEVIRDYQVVVTALNKIRTVNALQSSVTQISGDNFTLARELNIAAQLEGRVAGVNVSKTASGLAGSTRVVIRGAKSIGGLNQPLYVIDGIPMDNANFGQSGLWGGPDNGDGLTSMSPDDIESMTVLKGASSTALYGSRGANGVILISTKKGKARKGIGIEFNTSLVAEHVINYTDLQHSYGAGGPVGPNVAARLATKAAVLDGTTTGAPDWNTAFNNDWNSQAWGPRFDGTNVVQPDGVVRPYSYSGDNFNRFFKTGVQASNNIALTGGSERLNFRFSYSSLRSHGVVPNSGFNRDNVTLSASSKFGKRVTMAGKVMYSLENVKNRPMISDSPGNAVQAVYTVPGDQNITLYKQGPKIGAVPAGMTTPDGKLVGEELQATRNLWGQNPYWAAYQYSNSDKRNRVNASANIRYDLADFLYVTGQVGIDGYKKITKNLTPAGTGYLRAGSFSETDTEVREINWQGIIGFDKRFGRIRANAFVGGNRMRSNYETIGHGTTTYGINSMFGSLEISYQDFLFLTATAREDYFGGLDLRENRVLSPSIGASFVFTDAFPKLPTVLSFGKIRASYAQVGNASIFSPYAVSGSSFFSYFENRFKNNGGSLPNPNLKPSVSHELELGLDVRFFKDRLGLDFTYYAQSTKDDIGFVTLPQSTGNTYIPVNAAKLQNRGLEVLLTATPVRRAVAWGVSLNFAKNTNKVFSLLIGKYGVEEPRTQTAAIYHIEGLPFGEIAGFVQSKTAEGKLIYDSDGAPVTDGRYYILGNGVPKLTGGLNNSVTYKSFSLGILIDFKYGGQIYSGTNVRLTEWGYTKQSLQGRAGEVPLTVAGVVQTGTDGNGNAIYSDFSRTLTPGEAQNYWIQMGEKAADKFVYDASFIKLRQLTLSYSIPKSILSRTPLETLTLSAVSRNLALLYKKTPNIDPESSYTSSNAQGLDYFGMPPTRTYGFNLKVTF